MRVLLVSPYSTKVNPYISLLREGLASAGAEVEETRLLNPANVMGWKRPDVIHLHWIEGYQPLSSQQPRFQNGPARVVERGAFRLAATAPARNIRRWSGYKRLFDLLAQFQREGGRVAYTAHNLDPHEAASWPERRALRAIVRLADVAHAHDEATARELAERFGRRKAVAIIPHGNYLTAYRNQISRAEARVRLGLSEQAFVYLCLGLLRPYKGLEELVPAFRSMPTARATLLIAGKASDPEYAERIRTLADGDRRIRVEPQFVPGDEVQVYFNAADVAVLPYRQITTSGAAMLAFSFGAPVVAPAIGAFPELLREGRGVLYEPTGLSAALVEAQERDWTDARRRILDWVEQFTWPAIGRSLLAAYQDTQRS